MLMLIDFNQSVLVGVIGGSGLYHLDNLQFVLVVFEVSSSLKRLTNAIYVLANKSIQRRQVCRLDQSLCAHLDNLIISQPWGFPSSPITISSLPSGSQVAFLTRHGQGHTIAPSAVPSRANIAALKSIGV